jgi:CheY-like chemotaxis protein
MICKSGNSTVAISTSAVASCEGKRVMIIDDNMTNLRILKAQLQKRKITVNAASSGQEALNLLAANEATDLIITDMKMADMDGIQLSTRIKALYPHIPIILLSSIGNESKNEYANLFSFILTKPVRQQCLYTIVDQAFMQEKAPAAEQKKNILSDDFALEYPFSMLVAEDNIMNQKLILRVLSKLGYKADLANDGQEVLNMMGHKKYDIILMDVQMPNLDGLEATRQIRQQYGPKPIILAMTANALTEDKQNCYEAGMNGYLSKPIGLELLVNTLKEMHQMV